MFARTEVLTFFPTPIWTYDLPEDQHQALDRRLLAAVDGLVRSRPGLEWGECWQTTQDLHNRTEFSELTACIAAAARQALDVLDVAYDTFEITACWANVAAPGSWHRPHRHPNNFLSGVYYAKTQAGADEIHFHEPRPQANMIAPRPKHENAYNADKVILDAVAGRLIIFPAWLSHSVPPNASNEERVSFSFNVMLVSLERDLSDPRWQGNVISDVKTGTSRPVSSQGMDYRGRRS
ncbi:MAG: 2OG-Fe(II) oxygenase family protein [Alphaproteobacteria bacterium]